jgi:prevent-host-death family protein
MRHVNSTDFKTHLEEFLELVSESPVTINKRGKPMAVLVSVEEYTNLRSGLESMRGKRP